MQGKLALIAAFVLVLVLASAPGAFAGTRFRRQSSEPQTPTTGSSNLTEILSALNLTSYLQSASPQVQSAIMDLTAALQNQSNGLQGIVQSALQNASLQGQNVTQGMQIFLTNLQTQLSQAGSNVSANLNQSITNLQTFYNSTGSTLQSFANNFGSGIIAAAANFQNQIGNFTTFVQNGLSLLSNSSSSMLQQNIQTLNNSLSSGTLGQSLANILAGFQGRQVTFQQALDVLRQETNMTSTETQSVISTIQDGLGSFITNYLPDRFQNIVNLFMGLFSQTSTTTQATIVLG